MGMGYIYNADGVTRDFINAGGFEIEIACERYKATASLSPFLDPKNERIKV